MSKKDNEKRVKITIRNWGKHQREMRGGEKRKRRRDWVAISTDLCRDPDIINLTIEQRWLWIALLCHAGAVGPVFELSASDARVLFRLRRSADFEPLSNQGLIDLEADTRQDSTRQDKTVTLPSVELPAAAKKKSSKKVAVKSTFSTPDTLNAEAWDALIKYRREAKIKNPNFTQTTRAAKMKHFAKFSAGVQAEAVELTIRNGWQGCFPEKVTTNLTNQEQTRKALQEFLDDDSDRCKTEIREPNGQGVPRLPAQADDQGGGGGLLERPEESRHGRGRGETEPPH